MKEKERKKRWAKNNPEKIKENRKKYREDNPERIKEYHKQYFKNKRKTSIRYNLNHRMEVAINISLKSNKNGRHWETLVGYTLDDLIKRLKETLPSSYGWNDYLENKLHIDHRILKSVFNYTKSEHIDFRRCWALKNLRLLPAKDNLIKKNKLIKPFQPALRIFI